MSGVAAHSYLLRQLPGVKTIYPGGNGLAGSYPGGNFSQGVIIGCYSGLNLKRCVSNLNP